MKMLYTSSASFPSTRAHSVQIMNMSEAFAECSDFLLLAGKLKEDPEKIFGMYGISKPFKVTSSGWPFAFGRLLIFWTTFRGYWIAKKFKPDILYVREFILCYLISKLWRWRIALEVHSIPQRHASIFKKALLRADKIIVTNEAKRLEILNKFSIPSEKILLARNGVDVGEFSSVEASKVELRNKLDLPIDKKLFGFAGQFTAKGLDKGLLTTLQAFSKTPEDFFLVFVGGGEKELNSYKQAAKNYGIEKKLILHGQVPHSEVPKWLKAMDFLIFPYSPLNEHLIYYMSPIKIAEYMASGIPIITSDLPAVKEILPNDMAIYFKAGDADDFALKINWSIQNLSECLSKAELAAKKALEFSWQKRAEKILKFLKK